MRLPIYHHHYHHHYSIGFDFDLSIVDLNLKFYDLLTDLLRKGADKLAPALSLALHFLLYYFNNGKFTVFRSIPCPNVLQESVYVSICSCGGQ